MQSCTYFLRRQIVRKKATIALLCLCQRTPDLLPQLEPYFRQALLDKDPSVVFAALSVWKHIVSFVRHLSANRDNKQRDKKIEKKRGRQCRIDILLILLSY